MIKIGSIVYKIGKEEEFQLEEVRQTRRKMMRNANSKTIM